eukprot:1141011-Pelagomonas_calceolata.AAC.2
MVRETHGSLSQCVSFSLIDLYDKYSILDSTLSASKLMGIFNSMGMKFTSTLDGKLVVQPQMLNLIKGMFQYTCSTTQEDDKKSRNFCTNSFAGICMLPLHRLQMWSKLSHPVKCAGPVCGPKHKCFRPMKLVLRMPFTAALHCTTLHHIREPNLQPDSLTARCYEEGR